jgi:SAM-dependent methyltransferase
MHPEAYAFIAAQAAALPLEAAAVLEIGSYDVNGSVRGLFAAAPIYVGMDVRPGPGVDLVSAGADAPGDAFGVVVSTECIEHDPAPAATIGHAARALRPGGVLLLTCAGPGRAPHGMDGRHGLPAGEYYANVAPDDLRAWLAAAGLTVTTLEHYPARGDVYAVARKGEA